MFLFTQKIINKERTYDGYFKIDKYTIETPDGKTHFKECFERGESVAAIVYDTVKDKFLFTRQFRIGSQSDLLEIVAGSMDKGPNETPSSALIREIKEELGYELTNEEMGLIEHISSVYVSPGGTSEKIHIFFVPVSNKTEQGGGVEDEMITTVELDVEQLQNLAQFTDAKTLIGVQWFLLKAYTEKVKQEEE